ncbi:TRAP transporter large permease subunit [Elioraea sp. Yellowstone]|jgi:tripartite ATP-independent transporter DctM subunit|uniref:TRAP transporter large permease n=1 Tax=Elioraea sp. Yellowstone TaxID=2592070 RepID=UPI00114DA243|nr:TRAP transporter large permease subunit [Elioraea sp. Yellowstone]TQF81658.1 TRAP transporter large permease subunit [Elioraea sp. Yellowstone]
MGGVLDILMFATLCVAILTGFPVVFILTGTALLFGALGWAFGAFTPALLGALPPRIFGTMTSEVLVAIPLFVFMGIMLERSKIAEELLETMGRLFGSVRGGLAVSVSVVGALLAASTGIVGATVVTMGLMALPAMLRNRYDAGFACGTICAAGTLGQIIPPSTVMVILGEIISAAYQQAQLAQGRFSITTVSVGQLFAGSLLPGLMLVGIYILYQLAIAWARPDLAPALPRDARGRVTRAEILDALAPPIVLIVAVLGSILGGIATPTEAAAVGAAGATLLAARRLSPARWPQLVALASVAGLVTLASLFDLRLGRAAATAGERAAILGAAACAAGLALALGHALRLTFRTGVLGGVARSTTTITAMIFAMLIGATLFALVFRGLGGDDMVHAALSSLPGGAAGAIAVVMAAIFGLGFFLDFVEIAIIVIPIVGPIILQMDVDPIWFGVLIAVNLQTSFLTPPFGFSLFYLRGVAPREVRTGQIYRGVAPFVGLQLAALALTALHPPLATWLPRVLFGR